MTHSGGKPHAVGDQGQQYEVTYFDPNDNQRHVMGWSDTPDGVSAMTSSIEKHPSWTFPMVRDRDEDRRTP